MSSAIRNKSLLMLIVVAVLCSGCALFTQKFQCNASDVETISIVEVNEGRDENGNFEYQEKLLCEVTDVSAFIATLNSIECRINGGDPVSIELGSIAIKITYKNGDRDLLTHNAQMLYRIDTGYDSEGFWWFDQEQFEALISKYYDGISDL